MENKKTELYRCFGESGELLYVGISYSALNRLSQHRKAQWSGTERTVKIEKFATRQEAISAERAAIKREKPLFNVVHASKSPEPKTEEPAPKGEYGAHIGSLNEPEKWRKLIYTVAEVVNEDVNESGYSADILYGGEFDELVNDTLQIMDDLGVVIPKTIPKELDVDWDDDGVIGEIIDTGILTYCDHPIVELLFRIYGVLTDINGYYVAYIHNTAMRLAEEEEGWYAEELYQVQDCLMYLAAAKMAEEWGRENYRYPIFVGGAEEDRRFGYFPDLVDKQKFERFQKHWKNVYADWIKDLKLGAYKNNIAMPEEFSDLVSKHYDYLGDAAERKSLGLCRPIHPDTYMDELITGLRAIHCVLPVILENLNISEEDKLVVGDKIGKIGEEAI